jgi:hypothetical protein
MPRACLRASLSCRSATPDAAVHGRVFRIQLHAALDAIRKFDGGQCSAIAEEPPVNRIPTPGVV